MPSETIGDAYLAATGCMPHSEVSPQENAARLARMALDMQVRIRFLLGAHPAGGQRP